MPSRLIQTALLLAVGFTVLVPPRQAPAQPPVSYGLVGDPGERDAQVEAALERQVSVNFVYTPLRDFAAEIGRLGGVNCVLEVNKLAEATIKVDHPVNITLHNVSLKTVLRRALREIESTYLVEDGVVVITTPEDAQNPQNLVTRIYPVRDLVETYHTADQRERMDFTALTDLIFSSVEPDSWNEVGGPGSMEGSENAASLVIVQRRDLHHKIEALLTTLRKVKGIQNLSPPSPGVATTFAGLPTGKLSRSLPVRSRTSSTVLPVPLAPSSAWQLPQLYSGR